MAGAKPVPFLRVTLGGVRVQIDASNNPWIAEGMYGCRGPPWLAAPEQRGARVGSRSLCLCCLQPPSQPHTDLDHGATPGVLGAVMGRQLSGREL